MVVAELPLWLCHTSNAPNSSNNDASETSKDQKATDSLGLWQKASKKAGIYGIDIHPEEPIAATAGADGTVRLWNTGALFGDTQGGRFDEDGAYVSTSGGESEDSSVSDRANGNGKDDEFDRVPDEELNEVHDLSNVVRRKKDGSTATPSKADAASHPAAAVHRPSGRGKRRLLCTLSAHTGSSVLAVRFSNSGRLLASAGDDAAVCIYAQTGTQWHRIQLCRGHGLDVVDLAWAPDDSHLVSCSLDSETPIIVWKLTHLMAPDRANSITMICQPYKILGKQAHTSTVKGVTFDPVGSYLASSGDDPAVCIWRAHDDWGLEAKIDASSGIFRQWSNGDESTATVLSNQSLFRRLSWSTDGAFVCATNAVIKNKHVASTIARGDGWHVSNAQRTTPGAANLVGHKQPVTVSRHARHLLAAKGDQAVEGEEDDEDVPEYATLLALGDRRGFVTVWSTRKSRPLFKLQCSEARCTVTDLAWGRHKNDLMLLVSLLDGQVVALKFSVPDELGRLLTKKEHSRVFALKYGMDILDDSGPGGRLFVGENTQPQLIENTLQMTLEDDASKPDAEVEEMEVELQEPLLPPEGADEPAVQVVSRSKGKKRIRPVLVPVGGGSAATTKRPKEVPARPIEPPADPLQNAVDAAKRASAVVDSGTAKEKTPKDGDETRAVAASPGTPSHANRHRHAPPTPVALGAPTAAIPHSTNRTHSVELTIPQRLIPSTGLEAEKVTYVAEVCNAIKVPSGSKGSAIPCLDMSLRHNNRITWKDQIPGASCSSVAACTSLLAVGMADGSVQLYGTSPTLGWTSGKAFRGHAPLIFGQPIVSLHLQERNEGGTVLLLVLAADGAFGVYSLLPSMELKLKGSVMPALTHMALGAAVGKEHRLPKVARLQITESDRIILLLSYHSSNTSSRGAFGDRSNSGSSGGPSEYGAGGSLQAFVYEKALELWIRVADGRFVLSDFYTSLPSAGSRTASTSAPGGVLGHLDDAVRMGSLQSTMKSSHRSQGSDRHGDDIYNQTEEESGNYVSTRSHCEDRMSCALAMGSASEFKHWLSLYTRALAIGGLESLLRMLVDLLMGFSSDESCSTSNCWWLSSAPTVLGLERKSLVRTVVIPEMSKNRSLQRITNEIALEIQKT